ncbi:hypothetical protein ABH923_003833 [Leifsonia sp. EB41]
MRLGSRGLGREGQLDQIEAGLVLGELQESVVVHCALRSIMPAPLLMR